MKILYSHPGCSTCKKAIKWLEIQGHTFEVKDIREERPTAQEIQKLMQENQLTIKQVFNTSGQLYKEQNMKEQLENSTVEQALDLLVSDGMLIKRPLLVEGTKATFGFKEETYESVWGAER